MKTMFSTAMFGRKDGGLATLSPKLGALEDILPDVKDAADSVIALISDLIAKLPSSTAGKYQAELDACKAQVAEGGTKGALGLQCLYDLFQRIKDESGQLPTTPPVRTVIPPPASSFPWIPVAIAGGAALLLAFALTRK